MHLIEFKICVVACNGSRVVVSHQIFFFLNNSGIRSAISIVMMLSVFLDTLFQCLNVFYTGEWLKDTNRSHRKLIPLTRN